MIVEEYESLLNSMKRCYNLHLQVPALMLDCDTNIDFNKDVDAKTE